MATFVDDTFTDTDGTALDAHTGETGAAWTQHPSYGVGTDSVINSNRLRDADSSNALVYYASGVPAGVEYDVQVTLRRVAGGGQDFSGFFGRLSTTVDSGYFLQYRVDVTEWRLFKADGGAYTQLGSYVQGLTNDTDYVARLEVKDATKKLFVDGVERISSTNNDITAAGRAGMRLIGSATASDGSHWDNFSATDIGVTTTRGMPFGHHGTAFGGGRPLAGNIR